MGLLLFGFAQMASATVIANYNVQGTYNDDYDMWVGVGNTASPDWSAQVAWTANGNFAETFGSIVLPDALVWDATWWLLADDNWGADVGNIINFEIVTAFGTYVSPDVPVYIPDTAARYAYIRMPTEPGSVPEPAPIALLGLGLAGLALSRKRKGMAA